MSLQKAQKNIILTIIIIHINLVFIIKSSGFFRGALYFADYDNLPIAPDFDPIIYNLYYNYQDDQTMW